MTKGMKSLLEHAFCGHVVQSLHLTKKERISSRTKCKSRCIYIVLPQTISDQLYCFSLWRRHRAWRILSWNLVCVYCTRPLCQPWTWSIRTTVLKIISNYLRKCQRYFKWFSLFFYIIVSRRRSWNTAMDSAWTYRTKHKMSLLLNPAAATNHKNGKWTISTGWKRATSFFFSFLYIFLS